MRLSTSIERLRGSGIVATGVVVAVAMGVTGCASTSSTDAAVTSTVTVAPSTTVQTTPGALSSPVVDQLRTSFASVDKSIPATVGVSVVPVGGGSAISLGEWTTGVAWSSIKVPLAIASIRSGNPSWPNITAAIANSDNSAAEALWSELGGGQAAAGEVQQVLRSGGDSATVVQAQRIRPGFTPFGQTQWSLVDQARFTAHLPCLPDAHKVLTLMGQVAGNQQWGVQALPSAAVKGGWGPGPPGGYLVRQLAVLTNKSGQFAITLAAQSSSMGAGTAALDRVAQWVRGHLELFPAGHCE